MYEQNNGGTDLYEACKRGSIYNVNRVCCGLRVSELHGMCELLDEAGNKVEAPIILHVDSQAAVRQITGEDSSGRAKHIAVRHKFVKDCRKKV